MKNDIDGKLEKINTDILFYFLLVISSGISFYIINEKKRDILDRSNNSKDVLNKMYIFNRRLIVFVNIYFLINVYNSYKEAINRDNISESELYQTKLLFWGVVFGFIGSLFYLPITNSNFIIKRQYILSKCGDIRDERG